MTYYLGFRDDFDLKVRDFTVRIDGNADARAQTNEIIDRICAIEERVDPKGCAPLLRQIRTAAECATHM